MAFLLELKESFKKFYNRYNTYVVPASKFIIALICFIMINTSIGYMDKLKNPVFALLLSVICAFLPGGFTLIVLSAFILIQLYVFAPEFARDLDSTFEYISHVLCADKAAKELMKEIDDSIMNLKNMPYMYPECNEPLKSLGYRKIVVKNYILIYEVDDEKKNINLLRIFYGRSDYMRFFN